MKTAIRRKVSINNPNYFFSIRLDLKIYMFINATRRLVSITTELKTMNLLDVVSTFSTTVSLTFFTLAYIIFIGPRRGPSVFNENVKWRLLGRRGPYV